MAWARIVEGRGVRREWLLLAAGLVLLSVLRFETRAPDPWEWDEILFTNAVRSGIDVRLNRPHPPGYPLFVYPARAIAAAGVAPFQAATVVGLAGGIAAVVAAGTLLAAAGASAPLAVLGAALFAFTPAVWLHGVRPVTDGLGAAAFCLGATLFLRSWRSTSPRLFLAGTLVATLGVGVRPQVGVFLLPVALLAAWRLGRSGAGRRALALSAAGALALTVAIWLPVVRGSGGWTAYREAAKAQTDYVRTNDAPDPSEFRRQDLWQRWWLDPFGDRRLAWAVYGLAAAGLVRRPRIAAPLVLLFLPVAFASMGMLDRFAAARYSNAFLPLPALLAALGVDGLSTLAGGKARALRAVAGSALVGAAAWTGFAPIVEVATRTSPPVAAMIRLRDDPAWAAGPVAFGQTLYVHVEEYLRGRPVRELLDDNAYDLAEGEAIVMADRRVVGLLPAVWFAFEDPLLARISRGRYLSVGLYRADADVGLLAPRAEGNAWWDGQRGVFHGGISSTLLVSGALRPVVVDFTATTDPAAAQPPRFRFETAGDEQEFEMAPGAKRTLSFEAFPDAGGLLFRVRCLSGDADFGSLRFSRLAGLSKPGAGILDDTLPCSVDSPPEGAEVRGPLEVAGWAAQRGGGRVDPIEFRLDGILLRLPAVARVPRPDVAAAVPAIGRSADVGWQAIVPRGTVADGRHRLVVTFRTPDGRTRSYPPRTFTWLPAAR